MSIRNLELRAMAVVEGFRNGLHRSPYHGFSVEFTEYRQYMPGDDPKHLDWKVFGRSDRYYLKKFEDETNLRCHLVVDKSRSMEFGSTGYSKAEYSATLAATLAYFLHLQGDAVGLMSFDSEVREYLPARHRSGHLRQLMLALQRPSSGKSTSLILPIQRVAEIVKKRGLVVIISDFLTPLENLRPAMATLTACGHEVALFQILDHREREFDFEQSLIYEDLESGQTLHLDPRAVRNDYRERLEAHIAGLGEMARSLGIGFHLVSSDQPVETGLRLFLQNRRRRDRGFRADTGSASPP
jgi:uncharacterized protein (DUF58 family)